jgi:hypothetical protein
VATVQFFDEPCTFEVKRGVVITSWPSGECLAFPLDVFRIQLARANEAVNAYDRGNIYEFPRPKRPRKRKDDAAEG